MQKSLIFTKLKLYKEIKKMKRTVYFLIDLSDSMRGSYGDAVNTAMEVVAKTIVPQIMYQKSADLTISFKVIGFKGEKDIRLLADVPFEDFPKTWKPIPEVEFGGGTPTGAAIKAVIVDILGYLHGDVDSDALPPVLILISDGISNGRNPTYEEVMECADRNSPRYVSAFRKAVRVAIGVNVEEEGRAALQKFGAISHYMRQIGIQPYYDCSAGYPEQLFEGLECVLHETLIPHFGVSCEPG